MAANNVEKNLIKTMIPFLEENGYTVLDYTLDDNSMIEKLENHGYIVGDLSIPLDSFLAGINEQKMVKYLQKQGLVLGQDGDSDEQSACNQLFGKGASAEHVRLLEVIVDKVRYGNPSKLIEIIQNAQI